MDSYSSQKILIDKAQIDRLLQFYSPITSEHDSVQIALAILCHRLGTVSAAFERLDRALEAVQNAE